jgi:hypothetical protein
MRAFHDNYEPSKIDSEDLIVSYEKTFGALALQKRYREPRHGILNIGSRAEAFLVALVEHPVQLQRLN